MMRILRAFAWMRWRVLLNSLERTDARDMLERFSLAIDQLGPIIAALLLVPSLLGMAALSAAAGFAAAGGAGAATTFEVLRFLMLAATGIAVIGPILIPVTERANPVRLLLLPIPRSTLYVAQASGALGDPWTLLVVPVVVCLPLGLAAGGALQAAARALAAGALFLLVIVGLSTVTAIAAQLVLRDRRRGELVALGFILIVPLVGVLTNALGHDLGPRRGGASDATRQERRLPARAYDVAWRAFSLLPSERYVAAARTVSPSDAGGAGRALALLAFTAAGLHALGGLAFGRLLGSPGTVSRRRTGGGRAARLRRLPGLSPAASAVAVAQMRLALRTPRGRSTLLSPLILFAVLAFLSMGSGGQRLWLLPQSGVGLAAVAAFVSLLATLPLAMNQFAIDGAGLTLELLAPISNEDLLAGKAVATGLTSGAPALVCLAGAALLFPGGSPALWICVPIGLLAMYLLVAPAAALVSILFPKVVDLNSVGRGSNAHGLAGLLGIVSFVVSAAPPIALALGATVWLDRPELAPLLVLAWCAVAGALDWLLFRALRPLLAARRENLALVSS